MEQYTILPLRRFVLPADKLAFMPADERSLMIWCGHIHNELTTLLGFFRATANTKADSAILVESKTAQQLTIMKIIAGKLYEAKELLRVGFFGTQLSKIYEQMLYEGARGSIAFIKEYFDKKQNTLYMLRNNYAFHYDFNAIKDLPNHWESSEDELSFCTGNYPNHNLYFMSEVIINKTMLQELGAGRIEDGVEKFWGDISKLTNATIDVCGALVALIIKRHIASPEELDSAVIGILNPPASEEPSVPYFVLPPIDIAD